MTDQIKSITDDDGVKVFVEPDELLPDSGYYVRAMEEGDEILAGPFTREQLASLLGEPDTLDHKTIHQWREEAALNDALLAEEMGRTERLGRRLRDAESGVSDMTIRDHFDAIKELAKRPEYQFEGETVPANVGYMSLMFDGSLRVNPDGVSLPVPADGDNFARFRLDPKPDEPEWASARIVLGGAGGEWARTEDGAWVCLRSPDLVRDTEGLRRTFGPIEVVVP